MRFFEANGGFFNVGSYFLGQLRIENDLGAIIAKEPSNLSVLEVASGLALSGAHDSMV